ncbi:MAG: hypothetical protein WA175_02100 [Candidatus Acidiferrales bacterium]
MREDNVMIEKRRCKRLPLNIPVRVYGRTPDNLPFRDITVTKAVNIHGGLLPLAPKVKRGQTILLVNGYTGEERECRVVYVRPKRGSKAKGVGIEFTDGQGAAGDFWCVFTPLVNLKTQQQTC